MARVRLAFLRSLCRLFTNSFEPIPFVFVLSASLIVRSRKAAGFGTRGLFLLLSAFGRVPHHTYGIRGMFVNGGLRGAAYGPKTIFIRRCLLVYSAGPIRAGSTIVRADSYIYYPRDPASRYQPRSIGTSYSSDEW